MRKTMLIIILILTMLLLVACNAEAEAYEEEGYVEEIEDVVEEVEETEEVQEMTEEWVLQGLTAQHFLEDLDYMLYVLENNFALFDVAYWARGVDIYAIVDDIRTEIDRNSDMDIDEFFDVLALGFSPLVSIAHFGLVTPNRHHDIVNDPNAWENMFFTQTALARLQQPHVMAFYEPRHGQPQNPDILMTRAVAEVDIIVNVLTWHGEHQLAEEIVQAIENGDNERATEILEIATEMRANSPNVTMRIMEEGRAAYLTFDTFWNIPWVGSEIDEQILGFFEEIRDYEHLIVDLRRTFGGSPENFFIYVMGPNIEHNYRSNAYIFSQNGTYAAEYAELAVRRALISPRVLSIDRELRPIAEMLEEFDISDLNMADMVRMNHGHRAQIQVNTRRSPQFDNQPAFGGQIWLLTSPQMGSAVQIAAWVAKDTGFATLVGDITGGVYGGPRTFVALPNSGIAFQMDLFYVTDSDGRPLEAGTIPHYFNREGMDALETVLAMIKEGVY